MGKFVQALVVVVGFTAAIVAVKAEQSKPSVGNCYEMTAPDSPTACN